MCTVYDTCNHNLRPFNLVVCSIVIPPGGVHDVNQTLLYFWDTSLSAQALCVDNLLFSESSN